MFAGLVLHLAFFKALFEFPEAKVVVNAMNNEGCTPLFCAVRSGNPMCSHTLIKHGAELNIRCKGRSPLFEAMQLTDAAKARKLVNMLVKICLCSFVCI